MKKIYLLFVFLTVITCGFSQQIHSPAEIVKIMSDSKLSYEITILDKTIECTDFSEKLNYHDCYRVSTDSGLFTYNITVMIKPNRCLIKLKTFFSQIIMIVHWYTINYH